MTKTAQTARIVILFFYSFFFLVFLLIYKNHINKLIENKYVLIKNVKINSVYRYRSGSSHSYSINFKDGKNTEAISLAQGNPVFIGIVNGYIKTIDLVKVEKCNAFIQCTYNYYQYDNRFICDKNGICHFTTAYRERQVMILILGAVFFIIVSTIMYKLFNSKFVKTL